MTIRILIDREKLKHLEPLDAGVIQKHLEDKGHVFKGISCVIADDEKVIIVFEEPPVPIDKVAVDLNVAPTDIDILEFEHRGKKRVTLFEGINKKGRYEKIELLLE
ncbi:MAG: hypothetical protein QXT64_00145 [Desulfurococcaceae archaeon]|uniref:Uncharacterized protein n=1 Tax=Ligamenvirales sp. TaxID=2832923 RepID=A0AAU6PX84_9VIRU